MFEPEITKTHRRVALELLFPHLIRRVALEYWPYGNWVDTGTYIKDDIRFYLLNEKALELAHREKAGQWGSLVKPGITGG